MVFAVFLFAAIILSCYKTEADYFYIMVLYVSPAAPTCYPSLPSYLPP